MDPSHASLRRFAASHPSANPQPARPLRLGDVAPDFTAISTMGHISFHRHIRDSWALLFSHPADFTPVCTTELGLIAQNMKEWSDRNVRLVGISIGSVEEHNRWIEDLKAIYRIEGEFPFPIIADDVGLVASLYGMVDTPSHDPINVRRYSLLHMPLTVRSVFVIDPSKRIRAIWTYPASTGRCMDEMLRVVDSLQLTDRFKVSTPADWKPGSDVIVRHDVSPEECALLFPEAKTLLPYLRVTPLPENQ